MFFYDNDYTLTEIAKTGYSFLLTKLFYKKARLIRKPCYIRGLNRIQYGKGLTTGYNCRLEAFGERKDSTKKMIIGDNCKMGDNVHICASEKVVIGDNCLIASKVFISDTTHGKYSEDSDYMFSCPEIAPDERPLFSDPVRIGCNVWIGESVCILKGVNVGDGAIINAGSIVTKDVPKNSIVSGIPAKVYKQYVDNKGWQKV